MKVISKKTLGMTFFLLVMMVFPTIVHTTTAFQTRDLDVYQMSFIHAEYLDADMDGFEDDTRFSVQMYFSTDIFDGSEVKLDCLFEIILPSGITYTFKGYIRMLSIDCVIQFDVYNTVTEPGWYTINFHSSVRVYNLKYTCYCTTIFDPPETAKPEGGGAPGISL